MPDLSTQQLTELFDQYGADLFALCYLQAGRPAQALDLMAAALCDMASSPRLWAQAASPREGFFRAAYLNCLDNSLRRPKRRKKKKDSPLEEVPRARPFTLTDPLRQVMKLRLAHKAALFCRERLGLSGEESARVLGTSPLRAQRLAVSALKKAGITQGQARANLEALAPGKLGAGVAGVPGPAGPGRLCRPAALPPGPPLSGRRHALSGPGRGGHLRDSLSGRGVRLVRRALHPHPAH